MFPDPFGAIVLASRVEKAERTQYAMYKYLLSKFMARPTDQITVSLEMSRIFGSPGDETTPITADRFSHVLWNAAVHHAYAAIEEMELEVRASKECPVKLKDGSNNPAVINDMIERLRAVGADLDELINWRYWAQGTPLVQRYPVPVGASTPFASQLVKVIDLNIVDAILYASTLRGKVSTHRLRDVSKSLTLLDVLNCQNLARRLILTAAGCWTNWPHARWYFPGHPGFGPR